MYVKVVVVVTAPDGKTISLFPSGRVKTAVCSGSTATVAVDTTVTVIVAVAV